MHILAKTKRNVSMLSGILGQRGDLGIRLLLSKLICDLGTKAKNTITGSYRLSEVELAVEANPSP